MKFRDWVFTWVGIIFMGVMAKVPFTVPWLINLTVMYALWCRIISAAFNAWEGK